MGFFFAFGMWLFLALLADHIASKKGRNSCGLLIVSLLLPIVGLIIAVAMAPDEDKMNARAIEKGDLAQCPACRSAIHPEATICPQCRTSMQPTINMRGR